MRQVTKEFNHPLHGNSFALPFLNLVLLSWLATKWSGVDGSDELAKVLYWMGTAPLAALTLYAAARQVLSCDFFFACLVFACALCPRMPFTPWRRARDRSIAEPNADARDWFNSPTYSVIWKVVASLGFNQRRERRHKVMVWCSLCCVSCGSSPCLAESLYKTTPYSAFLSGFSDRPCPSLAVLGRFDNDLFRHTSTIVLCSRSMQLDRYPGRRRVHKPELDAHAGR